MLCDTPLGTLIPLSSSLFPPPQAPGNGPGSGQCLAHTGDLATHEDGQCVAELPGWPQPHPFSVMSVPCLAGEPLPEGFPGTCTQGGRVLPCHCRLARNLPRCLDIWISVQSLLYYSLLLCAPKLNQDAVSCGGWRLIGEVRGENRPLVRSEIRA